MDNSVPCICPHAERSLGRLYGVSMGKGIVQLETEPGCLRHDPKSHKYVPHVHRDWCVASCYTDPLCHQCNGKKKEHAK